MENDGKVRLMRLITRHVRKLNESIAYYDEMLEKIKGINEFEEVECPYCGGKGYLLNVAYVVREEICEVCEGSGRI